EILQHDAETSERVISVAESGENDLRPELRPIPTHPPSLALVAPNGHRLLELACREVAGQIRCRVQARHRLADHLVRRKPRAMLGAEIPTQNRRASIHGVD